MRTYTCTFKKSQCTCQDSLLDMFILCFFVVVFSILLKRYFVLQKNHYQSFQYSKRCVTPTYMSSLLRRSPLQKSMASGHSHGHSHSACPIRLQFKHKRSTWDRATGSFYITTPLTFKFISWNTKLHIHKTLSVFEEETFQVNLHFLIPVDRNISFSQKAINLCLMSINADIPSFYL